MEKKLRTNAEQLVLWKQIKEFLKTWYYKPDTQALATVLSQYVAHFRYNAPPVWTFILAPSSGGKTTLIAQPIQWLPHAYAHGEMTASTLLSGYGKDEGLLDKLPAIPDKVSGDKDRTHGVLCISDFSSILKLMPEVREKIQAQLREVYDGHYTKTGGNKDGMEWKGKVTIIACCTPSLERYWSLGHELGERFLMYRMPSHSSIDDLKAIQKMASKHSGKIKIGDKEYETSQYLKETYKRLILNFVKVDETMPLPNNIDDYAIWEDSGLIDTGTLLAKMRRTVNRDMKSSKREIISVEDVESPARLHKALVQLAIGYSTLFREKEISKNAIMIAKKVCIDSIPKARNQIVHTLYKGVDKQGVPLRLSLSVSDIQTLTHLSHYTVHQTVDDLCALGILKDTKSAGQRCIELEPEVTTLLTHCYKVGSSKDPQKRENGGNSF